VVGVSPRALVVFDKFRASATAAELDAAAAAVLRDAGWEVDTIAASDGGEGFRSCFVGETTTVRASDAYGEVRDAPVTLASFDGVATAILESAEIIGRSKPAPSGAEAWRASSAGVGEALAAVGALGVGRVLLGVGGTATSDGGEGCYDVLAAQGGLGLPVVVACDVEVPFLGALGFAEQKGIAPEDLLELAQRLETQAARYQRERLIDVRALPRAGAGGGLAGALAVWGASLRDGFALAMDSANLARRLEGADIVVTGEGRLDRGSLEGKVVARVASLATGPVIVLCGDVEADAAHDVASRFPLAVVMSLRDLFGESSMVQAPAKVAEVLRGVVGLG
jgi:glycerate kinase